MVFIVDKQLRQHEMPAINYNTKVGLYKHQWEKHSLLITCSLNVLFRLSDPISVSASQYKRPLLTGNVKFESHFFLVSNAGLFHCRTICLCFFFFHFFNNFLLNVTSGWKLLYHHCVCMQSHCELQQLNKKVADVTKQTISLIPSCCVSPKAVTYDSFTD